MFLDLFQQLYFHLTQTNVSFLTQWLHHFCSTPSPDIFNQRSSEEMWLNFFLFLLISQLSSLFLSIINATLIHHSSMIVMRYHSSNVFIDVCFLKPINITVGFLPYFPQLGPIQSRNPLPLSKLFTTLLEIEVKNSTDTPKKILLCQILVAGIPRISQYMKWRRYVKLSKDIRHQLLTSRIRIQDSSIENLDGISRNIRSVGNKAVTITIQLVLENQITKYSSFGPVLTATFGQGRLGVERTQAEFKFLLSFFFSFVFKFFTAHSAPVTAKITTFICGKIMHHTERKTCTLHRNCDSIVTCTGQSLQEEEVIILQEKEVVILQEEEFISLQEERNWGCYSWKEGILIVRGRKEVWEERPRPPNPGGTLCIQVCTAFIASCMEFLVAMQRLHRKISSHMQGFTAFIVSCMECLVEACGQHRNICKWLQGLHSPCSITHGRIWIVAWAIWKQIT
ncbi:hypothetical protein VP01_427g1 [Puccinia sorghi]|uniref:Uncharacterized protein n=1 Tax=Puccinia sorghi TaxID=27349 RepID=A0A0L6US69_9BASI|nr:hypothetical protein VP01_427g1 [Puccinia sorghi]